MSISWDSLKDGLIDSKVREELQKKGYQPAAITALIPFGASTLWSMDKIDDNTFGRLATQNPAGKSDADLKLYRDAAESLRNLGRNNPAFAETVARRYQSDSKKYEQDARTFANEMYNDPALCRKVIELAQSQKITELEKVAKNPGGYMTSVAPKHASDPTPTSAPAPAVVVSGGGAKQAKVKKTVTSPSSPAPAPASHSAEPATGEESSENYTAEEAKAKFGKWMNDPKNEKLAKKISEKDGLRPEIEKRLEQNPNLVRNFMAKGNVAMYQSFLDKGDVNGFLNEFSGPVVTEAMPNMSMDGILKNGLSGFFDLLKPFLGMFGNQERGAGLFERLASGFGDPEKRAIAARTEMGQKIGDLLNSTDPEKREYGEYVAKNMMAEHGSGHDQNTKYLLVGAGFNLKQIGEVDKAFKDGLSVDISHLKVVSDPKTGQKIIQDPVVYKEAPSVQASAIPPKPTDWDAERAARDARQKELDGVQTFGIQPSAPPVVTNL